MKTIISCLTLLLISSLAFSQTTAIPDVKFEQALIGLGLDTGIPDGVVLTANIDTVTSLNVGVKNISDLSGIEDFIALTYLNCERNQLSSLNVSQNTVLAHLNCSDNLLTSLNVMQNTGMTILYFVKNKITNIDVTQNTALIDFRCKNNQLTSIDVNQNTALTTLNCGFNQLTSLDLSNNINLVHLLCTGNSISYLDVTQNPELIEIACWANELTELNTSQNPLLTAFNCSMNNLNNLDLSQNPILSYLNCAFNQLTSLNVTNNHELKYLYCYYNQIDVLVLSQNGILEWLKCNKNNLTMLDVSLCPILDYLGCEDNNLSCLNVKNGNNVNFTSMYPMGNPNLGCIQVDNLNWATANWINIEGGMYFSENCGSPCLVGTENLDQHSYSVSYYPNPTSNRVQITVDKLIVQQINLIDCKGKLIKSYSTDLTEINVADLTEGIYYIQIITSDQIFTQKIIKQ